MLRKRVPKVQPHSRAAGRGGRTTAYIIWDPSVRNVCPLVSTSIFIPSFTCADVGSRMSVLHVESQRSAAFFPFLLSPHSPGRGGLLRGASPGGPSRPCGMPLPCPRVIWALLHFSLQAHLAFSLTQGTQVPVIGESHWEIEMWAPGVTDAPGMPLLLPLLADRGRTWGNAHGHAYLQFLVIHLSSSALS